MLGALAEDGRLTRQRVYTGALKIEAVAEAAAALHDLPGSPRTAADVRALMPERYVEARDAFCSVDGLGVETFEYLLLLLGAPGRRAVAAAAVLMGGLLGRELATDEAAALLADAAGRLGMQPTQLAHALWRLSKRS